MDENVIIPIEASLTNPRDPVEVTMVADVAGVGTTGPTANGRVVRWTPDFLRKYAKTLVGKPVNVKMSDAGPGGHSDTVIGTVTHAFYDDQMQTLRVHAPLWKHYFPETISQLDHFFKEGKLQTSVELAVMAGDEDEDSVLTPTDGMFSGLGIVSRGADPRNRVLILAEALQNDREALHKVTDPITETTVLKNSYEWIGNQIADYISNTTNGSDVVITGTFPDRVYYNTTADGTWELKFSLDGDAISFGEPVQTDNPVTELVLPTTPTGADNMHTDEEVAEIKASLQNAEAAATDWKAKFDALQAEVTSEREARKAEALAQTRVAEIDSISPYKDETLKASHLEVFKTADDRTFEAVKALVLAAAEPKGGIAPEGGVPAQDPNLDPGEAEAIKNLPTWREELLASFGTAK